LGWKGHTSNTAAAYLVGLLCGYRALKAGIKECVFDLGMHSPTPQAKAFASVKGALDAGLKVPQSKEVLPRDERLRGEHIAQYAAKLKSSDENAYRARFSLYLKRGLPPEKLPEHFDQIKRVIITQYGG
jgi:large subunit ribosomal protein L18